MIRNKNRVRHWSSFFYPKFEKKNQPAQKIVHKKLGLTQLDSAMFWVEPKKKTLDAWELGVLVSLLHTAPHPPPAL